MKRIFSLLSALFFIASMAGYGQQKGPNISFDMTVHDFGELKEEDGVASVNFEFTNTGNEPLIVQRVTASCGCTTPSWTKEPVMPGEKGFVSAAYNPKNRPGHFEKTINVQTNSVSPTTVLRIKGNVTPKPLTIEDEYRFAMGGIRLKSNHVSFGTVLKGTPQTRLVDVINTSKEVQKIEIRDLPPHLQAKVLTPVLQPNQKGAIEVTYLSNKQNDWDFIIDRMNIYLNGVTNNEYRLVVSANVQEDFSSLTAEQKANAPKIDFNDKNFDFGEMKQGDIVEYEYKFTNSGNSDLVIRKVRASCGCTAIMMDKEIILPGQSSSIKMSFNSTGKQGKQNKTITVISNDPNNPREILWVRGNVLTN